jgi:HEAT repeat protein
MEAHQLLFDRWEALTEIFLQDGDQPRCQRRPPAPPCLNVRIADGLQGTSHEWGQAMTRFAKAGLFISVIAVAALAYCAHTQTPSLEEFFRTLVDHPSPPPAYENLRQVTGRIEGLRPEEITKALPAIFAAMAHQDQAVKDNALTALYMIARRPDGAKLLKGRVDVIAHDFLATPNPNTRNGEMAILGLLRPSPPEVVPVFLTFLKRTDTDAQAQQGGVIFELIQAAPNNPEVIAAIKEFLSRSLDSTNRVGVLNALGNPAIKDGRIITMVTTSLDDPDPGVRFTAIQALGGIGPQALKQAEPSLQRLAADRDQPANVMAAAKEALQRIHPPK